MSILGRISNFRDIAGARILPIAAAIAVTIFATQPASADVDINITYSSFGLFGEQVAITTPKATGSFAGQITLNGVTGLGGQTSLVAWCLDLFDDLQSPGKFNLLGQPLAGASNLIGGLISEGNNDISQALAVGGSLSLGGKTYTAADISAATQLAIWAGVYGADFSFSSVNSNASPADFNALIAFLNQNATPNVEYWTLVENGNQTLGTLPVPGPIVGAGLPGLIAACGGLLALARRRRKAIA